jgi:hypothetical protein
MTSFLLVRPRNLNLQNFPESFFAVISQIESNKVTLVKNKNLFISVFQALLKVNSLNSSECIKLFLFATQPKYIFLLIILRLWSKLSRKELVVFLQMHEPWYEVGRANLITRVLAISFNFILSKLSDRILLPSEQSFLKAKLFIDLKKLYQINLTFPFEIDQHKLSQEYENLKFTWERSKVISLFGGSGKDRNPYGFLRLAQISNKHGGYKIKFIRAGVDKKISIDYRAYNVIEFITYISESAKSFLFSNTHIVVVPYSYSTQSAVIPEALSQGKLLIVNDIQAFSYLKNKPFAFVVDFDNDDILIKCLNEIQLIDSEEYEKRSRLAIEYYRNYHSLVYLEKNLDSFLK